MKNGTYQDRSIFIDPDISMYERIFEHGLGIDHKAIVTDMHSCRNLFPEGYLIDSEFKEQVRESIRHRTEGADNLGGFLLTSSMMGGTGSGVGSFIL